MTGTVSADDVPVSAILGGKVQLAQPKHGYRASIDPILLAASLPLASGGLAVEFGCGAGAAVLCAARFNPEARFIGLEADPAAAGLARANIAANGLVDRVQLIEGDALAWRGEGGVDAVFFNPPFFDDPGALRAPSPERRAAWINEDGLDAWIAAGLKRLREGGRLTLIQRADRLGDILTAFDSRAGGVCVLAVHPRAGLAAKRVIISAVKASRAPLRILPALVLHGEDGGTYMSQADAILRGEAQTALATL